MSNPSNLLFVKTESKPFGVRVEWKWPNGSRWGCSLELQYLFGDGRLEKEVIKWPVSGKLIAGLKAGEHLQIRLRLMDKDGYGCNWSKGDWVDGVSSSDAGEYLAKIGVQVSRKHADKVELSGAAGDVLHALFFRGPLVDGDLPSKSGASELRELGYMITQDTETAFGGENHYNFLTPTGQEFAISYLVDSRFGKRSPMKIKDGQVFINDTLISCAIAAPIVKTWEQTVEDRLTEQSASLANLSTSIGEAVKDAIRRELQPGGLLYGGRP